MQTPITQRAAARGSLTAGFIAWIFAALVFLLIAALGAALWPRGSEVAPVSLEPAAVNSSSADEARQSGTLPIEEALSVASAARQEAADESSARGASVVFELDRERPLRGRLIAEGELPRDEAAVVVVRAYRAPEGAEEDRGEPTGQLDLGSMLGAREDKEFTEVARVPVGADRRFSFPAVIGAEEIQLRVEGDYLRGGFFTFAADSDYANRSRPIELKVEVGAHLTLELVLPPDATEAEEEALLGRPFWLSGAAPETSFPGGSSPAFRGVVGPGGLVLLRGLPAWEFSYTTTDYDVAVSDEQELRLSPFRVPESFRCRGRAGERVRVSVPLERGLMISGRVFDGDGAPISNARIEIKDDYVGPEGRRSQYEREVSDGEGRFAFPALARELESLEVKAAGFRPIGFAGAELDERLRLATSEPGAPIMLELPLERGSPTTVTLSMPDGSPVTGVKVAVRGSSSGETVWQDVRTGPDGTATFLGLVPADYDVQAKGYLVPGRLGGAEDGPTLASRRPRGVEGAVLYYVKLGLTEAQVRAGVHLTSTMAPAPSVRGRVLNVPEGASKVSVAALPPEEYESTLGPMGMMRLTDRRYGVASFDLASGTFDEPLVPGEYVLLARTGRFPKVTTTAPVKITLDQGDLEVELRFPAAAEITGRVLDGDDHPLAELRVEAAKIDGAFLLPQVETQTAKDGSFSVQVQDSGLYRLRVVDERWTLADDASVAVQPGAQLDAVQLCAVRGGVLLAQVLDAKGQPLVGTPVEVRRADGGYLRGLSAVETDAQGKAAVRPIVPGPCVAWVSMEDADGNARTFQHAFQAEAGAEHSVAFDGRDASRAFLRGRVTSGGEPIADIKVHLRNAAGELGVQSTSPDGRFEFALMVTGPVTLTVGSPMPGSSLARSELLLSEGPNAAPTIDLPTASISGSLSRKLKANDMFGTFVGAIPMGAPKDALPLRSIQVGGSESWFLRHVPPGRYRIVTLRWDVREGEPGLVETDVAAPVIVDVEEGEELKRIELKIRDR